MSGPAIAGGNYTFVTGASSGDILDVANNYSSSPYDAIFLETNRATGTVSNQPLSPFNVDVVSISGYAKTSLLSSDALPPLSVYDVANFDTLSFDLGDYGGTPNAVGVSGSVTSLKAELVAPAAVPEASTTVSLGVLLDLGGLTLVARRRRMAAGR